MLSAPYFFGIVVVTKFAEMETGAVNLKKKSLSILELKRILIEIQEQRPDICIRYRLLGEMWRPNFVKIISVLDKGAFLKDESAFQLIHLHSIDQIMQFELDQNFQNFEAHFHYDITLDKE